MIKRLKILKEKRGQFANGSELLAAIKNSQELREEIGALSLFFLGREVSGCNNCYMDAFFELLHLNEQQIMDKANTHFHLRAGVLLRDVVNFDATKNMTNANISDSLALYHLRTNPSCRELFDELPNNVDELIAGEEKKEGAEEKAAPKKRKK